MEENTMAMQPGGDEQTMDERDGALISYDWERDVRPGLTDSMSREDIDAAWDAPASEERKSAPAPESPDSGGDGAAQGTESFRLKHLGREFDVTRDEIITLAQKGVDYDRIRERADRLAESMRLKDASFTADGAGQGNVTGALADNHRRERETREFISAYKDVQPGDIPQEVWNEVTRGKSLLSAYQSYENRMLRAQLDGERRQAQNRQKTTGPRPMLGAMVQRDELEADWYRD